MSLTPMPIPIEDYDAIQAAVMETGRGRWFLAEYARRNRHADTEVVLEAIGRIARMAGSPAERDVELAELAKFVQDARRAIVHVHETTGAAPLDYVVETMLTIEERLESLGGKTRAAAKLVAIADAKPAEVEDIEPEIIREAAAFGEAEILDSIEAEESVGRIDAHVSDDQATHAPAKDEASAADLPVSQMTVDVADIELFVEDEDDAPPSPIASAPEQTADDIVVEAEKDAALVPAAVSDAVIAPAGSLDLPDEDEVATDAAVIEDVPAVEDDLFVPESTVADDEKVAFGEEPVVLPALETLIDENAPAEAEDGLPAMATEEAAPAQPARRKPLPDSLRPDLPLVTAAELDALSFEEKIILFA